MKAISAAFLIIARQGEMNVFPKKIHSYNIVIRNFALCLAAAAAAAEQKLSTAATLPLRTHAPIFVFRLKIMFWMHNYDTH